MRVDGYTSTKLVHSSATAEVHEGVREADGSKVVLKRYLADGAAQAGSRAASEFHALWRIASSGVPRAVEVAASSEGGVLVLERRPGASLSGVIDATSMVVGPWLDLAIQLADALA